MFTKILTFISTTWKTIVTVVALAPTVLLNACNVVLMLINTVVEPIADETPTNKDNKICETVSGWILNTAKPFIGKLQTWLNRLGL